MAEIFNLADLNQILLVKLGWFIFVLLGLYLINLRPRPVLFLALFSGLSALAYFFFVNDRGLMFWGLIGDEVTIASMYEHFAHASFFSDFSYVNLPPFYPPLYFWIFAVAGKIFSLNGIQMAKLGTLAFFLFFPLALYWIQRFSWGRQTDKPANLALWLFPLIACIFIDWDAMIIKPYEMIGAAFTLIWTASLARTVSREHVSWKKVMVFGLTGGLLFMLYYLWIIFAFISLSLGSFWISRQQQIKYFVRLFLVGIVVLVASLPYLGPLVLTYSQLGAENWQTVLLTKSGISLDTPMFSLTFRGLLMLGGFVSLVYYWSRPYIRSLGLIFITSYLWQGLGLVLVLFFSTPIQEFKGFYFLNRLVLAAALAYALGQIYIWLREKQPQLLRPLAIIGLVFLSTQMFFGFFIDDPVVQRRVVESRQLRPPVAKLIEYLATDIKQSKDLLVLHSGIGELNAFLPLNNFIYFNQHNSHPAAQFSSRYLYVQWLSLARDSKEFHQMAVNSPQGRIDRFIFFTEPDSKVYKVYFELDNFPNQIKNEIVEIPQHLLAEPYFFKVYENEQVVIFDTVN